MIEDLLQTARDSISDADFDKLQASGTRRVAEAIVNAVVRKLADDSYNSVGYYSSINIGDTVLDALVELEELENK